MGETYLAERITNIRDLEKLIEKARLLSIACENELKATSADVSKARELLSAAIKSLDDAQRFEFRIERRTEHYNLG